MFKPIIAGITAVSLTFASMAPAYANGVDRDDVGKLLIGIAAIAALNAAIDSNNRNDRSEVRNARTQRANNNRQNWADLNRSRQQNANRGRVLPRECLRTIDTRFGVQRIFDQRCLNRNYNRVNRLPDRCAVRIYTTNGPRNGYDPLCLREAGFRATRRH
ncbi:hypothetical protein [Yoonia sp.]|uniref:hypothetical protein n=1 Tax=Yoonia sp. TaxID=2212373 RepID=UPI0023B4B083